MEKKSITVYIILVFLIILKIIEYSFIKKELNELNEYTNETFGIITKINKSLTSENYYNYTIDIEYKIEEKNYSIHKLYDTYTKNPYLYNYGEKINILYNPKNPEYVIPKKILNNQIKHFNSQKIINFAQTITFSTLIFIYYKKTKKKGESN